MGDEEMKERESWRLRHVRERLKEEMWVGIVRGGILMWQYLGRLKKNLSTSPISLYYRL